MEPLVAIGDVAVTRDDHGALWLREERVAGRMTFAFGHDWMALAGELPESAVRAVVPAARELRHDGGIWLALLPGNLSEPAVRFEAADGTLVRDPPQGRRARRKRTPCTACDAVDWEWATNELRCRACGHLRGAWAEMYRKRSATAVRDFPGPVYAVPGEAPRGGGMGWEVDGSLGHVGLRTDGVTVETGRSQMEPEDAARWAVPSRGVRSMLVPMRWRIGRRLRNDRTEALAAPAGEVQITVDGEPRTFVLVRVGERWAAATDGIVVSGTGPVPTELIPYSGNAS